MTATLPGSNHIPKIGDVYQHYKGGRYIVVYALYWLNCLFSETGSTASSAPAIQVGLESGTDG